MATSLTIKEDQTVEAEWTGPKNRGSLFQIMASGNVKLANALDKEQLLAVLYAVKVSPFPLGGGEKVYRMILGKVKAEPEKFVGAAAKKISLGELRKSVIQLAGDGCNAPHDSYLQIAYDIATNKTPVHHY